MTYQEVVRAAEALIPALQARAAETEALRQLPPETVADLRRVGAARIFQPARFGGCEAPLEAMVHVLGTLARGCASTAWVTAQHVSHALMLSVWPEAAQQRLWGETPLALVSGSLAAGAGRGRRVDGGYVLSGRWPWASGVNTCDWGIVAANTEEADGSVSNRHYLIPRADFTIVDVWRAVGLRGTSSNDIVTQDLFVPEAMTLTIDQLKGGDAPGTALNAAPLYRTPAYMTFGIVQGSVCLGIAQAALDLYCAQARERVALMSMHRLAQYPTQQVKVAEAATALSVARDALLGLCRDITATVESGALPDATQRTQARTRGAFAGRLAAQSVAALWDAGGGAGLLDDNPMSRLFRDISATQRHFSMNWDVNAIPLGRVLLGLDSGSDVL